MRIQMRKLWPSMFASARIRGTVFLRQHLSGLCLESGDTLLCATALVGFCENSTSSALRLDAALVKPLYLPVFFNQFFAVFVDIFDNGIELLSRQTRHRFMDKFEIVTAMKIVEDIHDRQPVAFDLRTAAEVNDSNGTGFHGVRAPRLLCLPESYCVPRPRDTSIGGYRERSIVWRLLLPMSLPQSLENFLLFLSIQLPISFESVFRSDAYPCRNGEKHGFNRQTNV